jgi:serine/threonine protein kinase
MGAESPLQSGTRLGPYTILERIGSGGMGEVYRAHDPKLTRDVAIKVLPPAFANDPERLSRFQREARMLASLNHPHIAAIYGFEDSSGTHALVMELVEGPTLADRIRQGPIPIEEALAIAIQLADALEFAHERGITDRNTQFPDVSPDGRSMAFFRYDPPNPPAIIVCDLPACKTLNRLPASPSNTRLRWTPDGRGIAYLKDSNVWVQPLDRGTPRQLTHFTDGRTIPDFAWSRDGKRLAIARMSVTNDIVLFKGLRK